MRLYAESEKECREFIYDYYEKGMPLPKRSLFLLFEDGRRDTAIYAQDILEELNYKGNILTYADRLDKDDPKFLMPKDLRELKESSYWDFGSQGYRLQFINVFDRYGNYIGEIDPQYVSGGAQQERKPFFRDTIDNFIYNTPYNHGKATYRTATPVVNSAGEHRQSITSPFPIGSRLRHATFGTGILMDAYRENGLDKLVVKFDKVGTKTMLQKFAKLELVN